MNFSFKKLIISNSLYAFFNVYLIWQVITPYFRESSMSAMQISTLHTIQTAFWFIFLYLSGFAFDIFGARAVFFFGRVASFFATLFLLKPTFTNFVITMVLFGISRGVIYGKYTSYIYNTLSINNKLHVYPRVASAYYFVWDISISAMSYTASLILKTYDYQVLICAGAVLQVFAIIFVFFLIPSGNDASFMQFKSSSIKEIITSIIACMKKSKIFTYLILFYGFLTFITYPLFIIIGDMILVDNGWTGSDVAKYTTFMTTAMAIGTAIPILFFPSGISVKNCVRISFIQMFCTLLASIIYNVWFFAVVGCFTCMTYSLFQVSAERRFEEYSNKKVRGSATSFALSIGTMLQMANVMIVGFLAKNFSYQVGLIAIIIPICLIMGFLVRKLKI